MRATFKYAEVQRGWVIKRRGFTLEIAVEFTELEKLLIRQLNLMRFDLALYENDEEMPAFVFPSNFFGHSDFVGNTHTAYLKTTVAAQNLEQDVTKGLRSLKTYLDRNANPASGSHVVEI